MISRLPSMTTGLVAVLLWGLRDRAQRGPDHAGWAAEARQQPGGQCLRGTRGVAGALSTGDARRAGRGLQGGLAAAAAGDFLHRDRRRAHPGREPVSRRLQRRTREGRLPGGGQAWPRRPAREGHDTRRGFRAGQRRGRFGRRQVHRDDGGREPGGRAVRLCQRRRSRARSSTAIAAATWATSRCRANRTRRRTRCRHSALGPVCCARRWIRRVSRCRNDPRAPARRVHGLRGRGTRRLRIDSIDSLGGGSHHAGQPRRQLVAPGADCHERRGDPPGHRALALHRRLRQGGRAQPALRLQSRTRQLELLGPWQPRVRSRWRSPGRCARSVRCTTCWCASGPTCVRISSRMDGCFYR